jgi:hypothetical protein
MIWISSHISVDREQISVSLCDEFREIELESWKKKMKIILLSVGIFCLSLAQNISAEKTLTCWVPSEEPSRWLFFNVTIEKNEVVSITTIPEDADPSSITWVQFFESSIYSVPSKIFTKFPNVKDFIASRQNIQEINQDTFKDATNLERIDLYKNELTFLHADTFRGKLIILFSSRPFRDISFTRPKILSKSINEHKFSLLSFTRNRPIVGYTLHFF